MNWEQACGSGDSTRPPAMWPTFGFRTRSHMWVQFVVGSRPCSEFCGFPPSTKTYTKSILNTYLLLTEFEGRTVNRWGKTRVRNLQYGPRKRG